MYIFITFSLISRPRLQNCSRESSICHDTRVQRVPTWSKKRLEIIALFDEDWTSSIYYFSLKIVKARKEKEKKRKTRKSFSLLLRQSQFRLQDLLGFVFQDGVSFSFHLQFHLEKS